MLIELKRSISKDRNATVDERMVERVIAKCDVSGDGVLDPDECQKAVQKFRAFITRETDLKSCFSRFDKDNDQTLSRAELLQLLKVRASLRRLVPGG